MGVHPADGPVQRESELVRGRLGRRQGDREHGVGAEPPLVRGPVEVDHGGVDEPLVERVETGDRVGDFAADIGDSTRRTPLPV